MLSSKRHELSRLSNKGHGGAKVVLALREDMDSVIGTILLWNNFSNVLVASMATVLAVRLFSDSEYVLSATSIITTLVILIAAEITPKSIGVRYAERVAIVAARPLALLVRLTPVGKIIRRVIASANTGGMQNKDEGDTAAKREKIKVEELLALLHDKNTLAEVDLVQKSMLHKLIGLHELSIRDIMREAPEVNYIDIHDGVENVQSYLLDCNHSFIPLCDDGLDNIVGILNVRNALAISLDGKLDSDQLKRLATPALFFPGTIDPIKALHSLADRNNPLGLVSDEYGAMIGLVTLNDYLRHLVDTSFDEAMPDQEGVMIVSGDISVREVNLRLGLNLNEETAKTLGGMIVSELGHYPDKPGEKVIIKNIELEALGIEERQVSKVGIRRLNQG